MTSPVVIRKATEADLPLIYSSWIRSYRTGKARKGLPGRGGVRYAESQHQIVTRLLSRSDVRVACYAKNPQLILGWVCLEPETSTVHYVYVKSAYRGLGVVRDLLGTLLWQPCRYSHKTRKVRAMEGWVYHPEDKE